MLFKQPLHWLGPAVCLVILSACQQVRTAEQPLNTTEFDWTLGVWRGVRHDGAGGPRNPMTMIVEPVLGGSGQLRKIQIEVGGGTYRGFAVQVRSPDDDCWTRQYTNEGRGTFSQLQSERTMEGIVWRSVSPNRTRESKLVSERLNETSWLRTMYVSDDDGASWRVLWVDELRWQGTN